VDKEVLPQDMMAAPQEDAPMKEGVIPAESSPGESEYDLSPEQQEQIDNYVDNATLMIHSQPATDKILADLAAIKNPQAAVAKAANRVHDMLEQGFQKNQKKYNEVTLMFGAYKMIDELIELGEVAGIFQMDENQKYAAHHLAIQHYFGRGIKEGWIDAVELQKNVEPLMPQKLREQGQAEFERQSKPMGRSQQGGVV
jgi:hypothetical protein